MDELFEVKPAEFVATRDALAKQLREDGQADEAKEVKRLRRPSVVVWALNQLARQESDSVDALMKAGDAVRDAQQAGSGNRLRETGDALQSRVAALARRGNEILVANEVGSGRTAELEAALRAAALGGDEDRTFRDGRLVDLPTGPTGADMWMAGAGANGADDTALAEETARRATADARRRAEADVDRARHKVTSAAAQVEALEQRLERALDALRAAEAELRDAEERAAQLGDRS